MAWAYCSWLSNLMPSFTSRAVRAAAAAGRSQTSRARSRLLHDGGLAMDRSLGEADGVVLQAPQLLRAHLPGRFCRLRVALLAPAPAGGRRDAPAFVRLGRLHDRPRPWRRRRLGPTPKERRGLGPHEAVRV